MPDQQDAGVFSALYGATGQLDVVVDGGTAVIGYSHRVCYFTVHHDNGATLRNNQYVAVLQQGIHDAFTPRKHDLALRLHLPRPVYEFDNLVRFPPA